MQKIQSDVKNDPVSDNESPKDDWQMCMRVHQSVTNNSVSCRWQIQVVGPSSRSRRTHSPKLEVSLLLMFDQKKSVICWSKEIHSIHVDLNGHSIYSPSSVKQIGFILQSIGLILVYSIGLSGFRLYPVESVVDSNGVSLKSIPADLVNSRSH